MTLFQHTYTQAYSTSFVYYYTNIITLVCIQTVKKTVKWSLPMTCDVLSFNIVRKSLQIFSYWRSVENVPSKKYLNAVDHVHLWKMLYFKGRHKYP
jgi:hypothetical protein